MNPYRTECKECVCMCGGEGEGEEVTTDGYELVCVSFICMYWRFSEFSS